jgi:arsenate reductase
VRAYSAGSAPGGAVNPHALAVLAQCGVDTGGFRSKSWDEFTAADSPTMHIVITVRDSAAAETCPYWPGSPVKVHWGYPDPSDAQGSDEERLAAFRNTLYMIQKRLQILVDLPADKLQKTMLQHTAREISKGHA